MKFSRATGDVVVSAPPLVSFRNKNKYELKNSGESISEVPESFDATHLNAAPARP